MTLDEAVSFSAQTSATDLKAKIEFLQRPENTANSCRYINVEGVISWLQNKLRQTEQQ